ncbi:exosortase/archaeosortase family protein [bacterium]|nr:exosortase/archaeosortase family protein [bacterium]
MLPPRISMPILLSAILVLVPVAWAYWATFADIAERWANDPQYSHGFLVPLFSAYLLWSRRGRLAGADICPRWWGVGLIALGGALRLTGYALYQPWLDSGSLLVVLVGLVAAAGGRRLLAWAAPPILFLAFMIPLPYRAQTLLGGGLQAVATTASTYSLQTLGVPAVAEGNVILLTDTRMGVVEACGGLTMLVTFFALSVGVAMVAPRGWMTKSALVLSAAPIAVLSNVVRIVVTGVLFESNQSDLARVVFHDLAGWLMMPLGLILLLAELYVMDRAVIQVGPGPAASRADATTPAAAGVAG